MKVSILALSLNRYDVAAKVFPKCFERANYPFELIVLDNGSSDKRVIELIKSFNPHAFIEETENIGNPKALNKMLKYATGDLIVTLANDIIMPLNWLSTMVDYAKRVPYAGLIGIHCVGALPPLNEYEGVRAHYTNAKQNKVFSNIAIKREVIDKIGFYSEEFDKYGLADSDLCERVRMSGYMNFYIPELKSEHIGVGENDSGDYRKQKDERMKISMSIFTKRQQARIDALKA